MRIDRVTITGADDQVKHGALELLSLRFPFVEFGILFSQKRTGQPRYPSRMWVQDLTTITGAFSAHICGQWSRDFCQGEFSFRDWASKHKFFWRFQRVQINTTTPVEAHKRAEEVYIERGPDLIIPVRNFDQIKPRNTFMLLDNSGGRGRVQTSWPAPKGYCGYSGGIGPENIEEVCGALQEFEGDCWIDMESGVRTNDQFDLDKVKDVLEKVSKYVEAP